MRNYASGVSPARFTEAASSKAFQRHSVADGATTRCGAKHNGSREEIMRGPKSFIGGNVGDSMAATQYGVEFTKMARDGSAKLLKAIAKYHVGRGRKAWRAFL